MVLEMMLHLWLMERQRRALASSRDAIPTAFADRLTLQQHQQAADYGQTRLRYGQIRKVFNTALVITLVGTGILGYWDSKFFDFFPGRIQQPLAFLGTLAVLNWFIGLPWSWYSHFVLEERFGFNRMTQKVFVVDQIKGLILTLVLGGIILWPFLWLMKTAGIMWVLPALGIWLTFQLLIMGIGIKIIAPMFNKFTPLQNEELKDRVTQLVERAGFHSEGVFVMDASKRSGHGNAYFTGIGKHKRIVFFDTMLEKMTNEQTLAVLAHEIGHLRHGHIWKGFLVSTVFSALAFAMLAYLQMRVDVFMDFKMLPTPASLLILASWIAPLLMMPLAPIFSWRSRKHEFQADAYAVTETSATDLGGALLALYRDNAASVVHDPLYSAYFHSHPPLSERLPAMESHSA
jgi:STE24 endopeptidase